jgi:GTP-binding protein HflX
MVGSYLFETLKPIVVRLPYQQGGLISLFHEQGQVDQLDHNQDGVMIKGKLPGRLLARYQRFIVSQNTLKVKNSQDII